MLPRRLILLFSGFGLGFWLTVWPSAAQEPPIPPERELPEGAVRGLRDSNLPDVQTDLQEGGEPDFPYNRVIRNPQDSYDQVFYSTSTSGRLGPKAGGARLSLPSDTLQGGLKYNLPFSTAVNPTNAEIQLGRFYIDLLSISSSLLYSDNIDLTEDSTEGGWIGIVAFDLLGICQFTDNLRLSFRTGLIWLPLDNKFGVAGFTSDYFSGRVFYGSGPSQFAQLSYDISVGDWEIHFYDHLRAVQALYTQQFLLAGGQPFDEESRTGRYVFRNSTGSGENDSVRVNDTDQREAFIQVNNTIGTSISRLLPTVTRFEVGAFHSDMFYYGDYSNGDEDDEELPDSREVAYVSLSSERESLRFRPFASYRVFRSDEEDWSQEVRGGVVAPISRNIQFLGSAGYLWYGEDHSERMVANARLRHVIGPDTLHEVWYTRDLTYPEEDLENSVSYRLRQNLGPYLYAVAFAQYAQFEDLNDNGSGTDEWRTGLHFTSSLTSKTTLQAGGVYSNIKYDDPNSGEYEKWTAVGQIRHFWSDSWESVFTYQYQTRESTLAGDSYDENLFIFTLTYYFGRRQSPSFNEYDPTGKLGM